jgi:hypothetical protein
MPIATRQLGFIEKLTAGFTTIYTVPVGHRTILKTMVVSPGVGLPAGEEFIWTIWKSGVGAHIWRSYVVDGAVGKDTYRLTGWWVLEPGQWIGVYRTSAVAGVTFLAAGSELRL